MIRHGIVPSKVPTDAGLFGTHLDQLSEEPSADVVVRLEEDLPEPGLADGVVLGVELVEPVEGVAILGSML